MRPRGRTARTCLERDRVGGGLRRQRQRSRQRATKGGGLQRGRMSVDEEHCRSQLRGEAPSSRSCIEDGRLTQAAACVKMFLAIPRGIEPPSSELTTQRCEPLHHGTVQIWMGDVWLPDGDSNPRSLS